MRLLACSSEKTPCPEADIVYINSQATELLINGSFDEQMFYTVTEGSFLLWVTGFGIGMLIALARKSKAR